MRADKNNGRSKMNDRMNENEREGKGNKITLVESKTIPFTTIHGFRLSFGKSEKSALKMHASCRNILRLDAHFSPISFQPPPEPPLRDGVIRSDEESLPWPAKENSLEQHLRIRNIFELREFTGTSTPNFVPLA